MDGDYRRMKYVRYADDFLIGIIGSKEDTTRIKEDIKNFLESKLKLELSDEKTLITYSEKSAKFLGYEIYVRKSNLTKRDSKGRIRRAFNKKVYLKLTTDVMKKKLLEYGALEIKTHNSKEQWKPRARVQFINNDDLEILERYNSEIRGLYNYYSIANNCSEMNSFKYIMEYSMYKTFACKYRTTVKKICRKYKKNKVFTVNFKNNKGQNKTRVFYNEGFKRKNPIHHSWVDNLIAPFSTSTTSLVDRLKANVCELCGATDRKLHMHHARKLKGLDKKKPWEKHMIARRRKTIALCASCHKLTDIGKKD